MAGIHITGTLEMIVIVCAIIGALSKLGTMAIAYRTYRRTFKARRFRTGDIHHGNTR